MKFEEGKIGMKVVIRNEGSWHLKGTKGVIKNLRLGSHFEVQFENKVGLETFHPGWFDKLEETELPVPFVIKGEMHHLNAFAKDLEKLGYNILEKIYKGGNLRLDGNCFKSHKFERWKSVCFSPNLIYGGKTRIIPHQEFVIPMQWSEALKFAEDFIKHSFWNKEKEEILDIQWDKKDSFKISVCTDKIVYEEVDSYIEFKIQDLQKLYEKATENKFGDYILEFPYVSIGCKKNIPISEIKRIIDTYKKLNS